MFFLFFIFEILYKILAENLSDIFKKFLLLKADQHLKKKFIPAVHSMNGSC